MSNIINFNARLEARRRGDAPERALSEAVRKRLVARVDSTHGLEAILAFRADIEAARRRRQA